MKIDQIFSPYQLNKRVTLRNRLVLAPLNIQSSLFDGSVSLNDLNFHKARAKYVGLDIIGSAYISDSANTAYGAISVADDSKIDGLKKLATVIHQGGSKAILQLVHAGRMTNSYASKGAPVLAPSEVKAAHGDVDLPKAMTKTDIETVIKQFEMATIRAIKAGFDGVELHGANTFLFQQFMSPLSNLRTDEYGGSLENRIRFCAETAKRVLDTAHAHKPGFIVGYRISPEEFEPGALKLGDDLVLMQVLGKLGIDYLSLSLRQYDQTSITCDSLSDLRIADIVKQAVGDELPIMVAGHLGTQFAFERASGDMFAVGSKFLKQPNWPSQVRNPGIQPESTVTGTVIPYTTVNL